MLLEELAAEVLSVQLPIHQPNLFRRFRGPSRGRGLARLAEWQGNAFVRRNAPHSVLNQGLRERHEQPARFPAAVFPVYLVAGQLFWCGYPHHWHTGFSPAVALMGDYAALFAAGYPFY